MAEVDAAARAGITRECNGCSACCYGMTIEDADSPLNTSCQYQCSDGCIRYETRPEECRHFECLWRAGWGQDEDRPDKIGFFLFLQGDTKFGDLVCASPSDTNSMAPPEVMNRLSHVACKEMRRLIYVLTDKDEDRKLIGPDAFIEETLKMLKKDSGIYVTGSHITKER